MEKLDKMANKLAKFVWALTFIILYGFLFTIQENEDLSPDMQGITFLLFVFFVGVVPVIGLALYLFKGVNLIKSLKIHKSRG